MPVDFNVMTPDGEKWKPQTLTEAVDFLYEQMTPDERVIVRQPESTVPMHFGIGLAIRNEWKLWERNELTRSIGRTGDDASSIILSDLQKRCQE